MATLYMMRHGQTLFNVLKRIQGWCDSPLTELGMDQARRAGEWFRARGIAFDHAYTSTAERACDTFELAFPGEPYERVKGLREHGFGTFEGLSEQCNPKPPYGDFFAPFGGEPDGVLQHRIKTTLTELMERPGHESVLAVSHAGACAAMLQAAGMRFEDMDIGLLGNCAVIVYDYAGSGAFTLREILNPLG